MHSDLLRRLGLESHERVIASPKGDETPERGVVLSENPSTGRPIAGVRLDSAESYERTLAEAVETFDRWRRVPAPVRGQVVRAIGDEMRRQREALGELVSLEVGKIRAEGVGEVQETVDIADFAVGLSRQLYGMTMPSERPEHRMYEQWLPLGPIGVITAFNFPNAVWGWNAMLAAVCGDVTIWKPSLLAPLTAIASNAIADRVATEMGHPGVFRLVIGTDQEIGERFIRDRRLPLISATGSCRMGRRVGSVVAERLGRCLLELGGNNAIIVEPDADPGLAAEGIFFGAVGTAGQRCTTTRRLIVHESIADALTDRLVAAYSKVKIGDPLAEGTLVGPLITRAAVEQFEQAVAAARRQGGEVLVGGARASIPGLGGHYVQPTIIRAPGSGEFAIARQETFAPILYVFTYRDLGEAIAMQNGVDQGLSSAIFTSSVRSAERFLSPAGAGSDCGLAYVNLGTSGAEIGGAFGGEKDTGGGRESGSDSWKQYMRRQTVTINFGASMRLAQGIEFGAAQ
ncbi:MAG TPA: aldehyde dehydrogenase family protein [Phycisphaerales bacterium]|nr:aldehyde dehydrogenase family protein [Phycisphaerales bacterium]